MLGAKFNSLKIHEYAFKIHQVVNQAQINIQQYKVCSVRIWIYVYVFICWVPMDG